MAPRIIYFDIGNVLLSFSHERMCEQMAAVAGVTKETVWEFLFQNQEAAAVQWRYESGQIDTDAYFEFFCRSIGVEPDRARLEEAVCDIFEVVDGMEDLVDRLAQGGNTLGLLSNTNPLQWLYFTDGRFPLLASPGRAGSPFRHSVLSYEARSMKPDARIYEIAAERAGAAPNEVFFTDDREENAEGALAAGLDAVLFTGAANLRCELAERGVPGA